MKKINRIICFIVGHKYTFFDDGYPFCNRCNSQSYYDYCNDKWYKGGLLKTPISWLKLKYNQLITAIYFSYRRLFENDDLPF